MSFLKQRKKASRNILLVLSDATSTPSPPEKKFRITNNGDRRVTSNGDLRIVY